MKGTLSLEVPQGFHKSGFVAVNSTVHTLLVKMIPCAAQSYFIS